MESKPVWIIGYHANPLSTMDVLQAADRIYARGALVTRWLDECGIHDVTAVALDKNPAMLDKVVEAILSDQRAGKDVVYATMVKPLAADAVVKCLKQTAPDLPLKWASGEDFVDESVMSQAVNGTSGLTIIDGSELAGAHHIPFSASQAALVIEPGRPENLAAISRLFSAVYPAQHALWLLTAAEDGRLDWKPCDLQKMVGCAEPVAAILLPARSGDCSLESFEEVIAHLRAPNGCPWDRKQTHASLRTYLLEETYEALEALDGNDMQGLKEELGDLLLQILLHAQIGVESGEFNMAEVLEGINRKIVRRHEHVFGDVKVADAHGVVQNWEKIKQQEREENGVDESKGLLDGIPVSFPALAQAQSIQDRAARVGFDWKEIEPVMDKVMEEYREVQEAPDEQERAKELGDLLFAVVNLVRWYKVDAESALRETNLKFRKRFAYIEQKSRETGKPMQEMTLDEMDVFWNEAKKQ
jgi:tetrapyrrole methylase family protein/MazG family protein